jgi:hypothetical protein
VSKGDGCAGSLLGETSPKTLQSREWLGSGGVEIDRYTVSYNGQAVE